VVPSEIASIWLQQILTVDWKKTPQAGFAATLITRMSGDRARDIAPELRAKVHAVYFVLWYFPDVPKQDSGI
jgi:hypothetical protein